MMLLFQGDDAVRKLRGVIGNISMDGAEERRFGTLTATWL